jgi:ketosteroid isomerase-like protein
MRAVSQENIEIVRRTFEKFQEGMERGDLNIWFDSEDLADDFEWIPAAEVAGTEATYRGREGFTEFMRTWTENFDDWSVELERLIDCGADRVVGVIHQQATGKGSGVPVEIHQGFVWELEDGRDSDA